MNKFLELKYNLLAEKFFTVLSNFYYNSYLNVNKNFINTFINSFLDIFVKDEFIISPSYQEKFVFFSPIISNLAAISDIKNTDNYLNKLKLSQNNLYKILTLLSARNSVEFNINTFFDINPYLASLWYTHYFLVSPFITQVMYKNILNHIKNLDYRFIPILPNFNFPYAVSSYYDIENDRNIKLKINQELYNQLKYIKINNNPNKNKIAIISARWYPYSAIYRSYYDFIKELSLHYELILINLGPIKNIDTTLFKKVKYIEIKLLNNNYDIDLLSILNNDFIACMYLDLGTTLESIYLSNLNISPIQIAVHGNPISSFGSKINYYISGLDIEDIRSSCNNYTERLVLIPGLGLSNIYSDFTPNTLNKNDTKKYIILCPWGLHKLNYYILTLLKKIISLSKREIVFRFFLGFEYKKFNRFLPLKQELQEILGRNSIEIVTDKKYKDYLELLNEGKIGIFSYPFGGFNTAIDILSLAKPVIVYKGNKAHNKFVPTLLEKLNLNELIANNDEEYIDKILYLIHNDEYREELSCKIGKINLKESLDKINNPKYFKKAIDYLIDNHQHLMLENYKEPIIIT